MIKIKRRVVLHGTSTLTVSLPSDWVKKFNIKKGDELNLEEQGNELRVNTDSANFEKIQINIKNLKRVGKSYITSAYRQGYDEIEFSYEDEDYLETIQNLIAKEITGFEIIRQKGNYCIIKDLTGHSKDEFSMALRRIWLLLLDISNESLNLIKTQNPKKLKNIKLIDYSINKFSNYCLRILIKKGRYDFKKTPSYYHFVKRLEEIADKYKELCSFYSENPEKQNKEVIELFNKTNSYLNSVYELSYKYDNQKIENLFEEIKTTYNKPLKSKNEISFYLSFICKEIRSLLPLLIEINM